MLDDEKESSRRTRSEDRSTRNSKRKELMARFRNREKRAHEKFLLNDDYLIYNWLFSKEDSPKIFKSLIKRIQEGMHD